MGNHRGSSRDILCLIGVLSVVCVGTTLLDGSVEAHDEQLMACNHITSKKVGERLLANGLLAEEYDTDGDGKKDVVALSSITGQAPAGGVGEVPHQLFPTFYIIDVDKDGQPDLVYVDVNGDGKCASVRLYEDLNVAPTQIQPGQVGGAL